MKGEHGQNSPGFKTDIWHSYTLNNDTGNSRHACYEPHLINIHLKFFYTAKPKAICQNATIFIKNILNKNKNSTKQNSIQRIGHVPMTGQK